MYDLAVSGYMVNLMPSTIKYSAIRSGSLYLHAVILFITRRRLNPVERLGDLCRLEKLTVTSTSRCQWKPKQCTSSPQLRSRKDNYPSEKHKNRLVLSSGCTHILIHVVVLSQSKTVPITYCEYNCILLYYFCDIMYVL